jgi:hypothetical protein
MSRSVSGKCEWAKRDTEKLSAEKFSAGKSKYGELYDLTDFFLFAKFNLFEFNFPHKVNI